MKRRDFVKQTALTAFGAAIIGAPVAALADGGVTHLESEDVSPRAALADDYPLHFMAIGDWGRNGEYDQTEVAKQMGIWGANNPNNFVISVGDNFYPNGVISEQDPLFHYSFENIYTAHSLQCDWHVVMGNHDYHGDPDAQVRYSKVSRRWNMPARYYTKEVSLGKDKGKVAFIMMDTDPFLHDNLKEQVDQQMVWLNKTLEQLQPDVKWKIVVGHHPYYTVGPRIKNYDTLTMREKLAKVFEKHKVDIYLSGHDHSLQHLKPEGYTHQLISGAGSELTPVSTGIPYSKFEASEHGFMYFSVRAGRVNVKAINKDGKVIYDTNIDKA
ncbi:metallophosphoesterase [Mucilaginibacter gynuensis]|uniref:acid phosphatase n=1 Tax=Mucilaginibacter gynuensis TaxID=1302236 RepID=A0ABP8H7N4_9SPHI